MKHLIFFLLLFSFFACQTIVNSPPVTYELKQNFPNPFTDTTVVLYSIPASGVGVEGPSIKVVVNDRYNQLFSTLVNKKNHPAGHDFRVIWNGRGLNYQKAPPGIYYIEIQNTDDNQVEARIAALKE